MPSNSEKKYQTYRSSTASMKMMTSCGQTIIFRKFMLVTNNKAIISYLDKEIDNGFQYVTKGEEVSELEANPMLALRASMRADIIAEMEAEKTKAIDPQNDMGKTDPKAPALKPASTKMLAGAKLSTSLAGASITPGSK